MSMMSKKYMYLHNARYHSILKPSRLLDQTEYMEMVEIMGMYSIAKYMINTYGIDAIGMRNIRKIRWRTIKKVLRKKARIMQRQNMDRPVQFKQYDGNVYDQMHNISNTKIGGND